MEIDPDNTVRFKSPEVLFSAGSTEISEEFKKILDEFFPVYMDIVYNTHGDSVQEIRIEGHTSSEWWVNTSVGDAYFNNMELSQDRTREVLNYVINLDSSVTYVDWLRKHVTANGLSSSKLVIDEETGLEDKEKSRRVEFKIVDNSEEIITQIIEEGLSSH